MEEEERIVVCSDMQIMLLSGYSMSHAAAHFTQRRVYE